MHYNPDIHHRRTIRLKNYDYSADGVYFITLCTQHRENLFGDVIEGKIVLNSAGNMVEKWIAEAGNKFKNISFNEYVIMPNHLHFLLVLKDDIGQPHHQGRTHRRALLTELSIFNMVLF